MVETNCPWRKNEIVDVAIEILVDVEPASERLGSLFDSVELLPSTCPVNEKLVNLSEEDEMEDTQDLAKPGFEIRFCTLDGCGNDAPLIPPSTVRRNASETSSIDSTPQNTGEVIEKNEMQDILHQREAVIGLRPIWLSAEVYRSLLVFGTESICRFSLVFKKILWPKIVTRDKALLRTHLRPAPFPPCTFDIWISREFFHRSPLRWSGYNEPGPTLA